MVCPVASNMFGLGFTIVTTSLVLVIASVMLADLFFFCKRIINDEQTNYDKSGWWWLHQQLHDYIGFESGKNPEPAPLYYIAWLVVSFIAGVLWFISVPFVIIASIVFYLRYEKRKEKI